MGRILVIEDEADLRQVLDYNLRQAGHDVTAVALGQDGLRLARAHRPDLLVLDLMLPDLAGTEVCKALKRDPATRDIAVLMLTAKGEEIDRVLGFELGAEDYVVKPFSVRELLLRIQALLARRGVGRTEHETPLQFGVLRIDEAARRAWVEDREMELTPIEFKLLLTLCQRRNRVQSRAALLDEVWGIDVELTTRTVDTHVKRLREKLGPARDYIQTVRSVGYRFDEKSGQ
jgi:two-component system, OmpR family, phosphate regulon response regulator PhoB